MASKSNFKLKKAKKAKVADNKTLERAMVVVAVVEPLMTIPQIVDLFSKPGQDHVSVLTWILYMVTSVMWLVYGLYHKNMPLILTGALWVIMEGLVVVGAVYA